MWICPTCKRQFKNRNQYHSCGNFSIEQVFEKQPAEIFKIFKTIHERIKSFGDMQIRAVKNGGKKGRRAVPIQTLAMEALSLYGGEWFG